MCFSSETQGFVAQKRAAVTYMESEGHKVCWGETQKPVKGDTQERAEEKAEVADAQGVFTLLKD